jgi:hypothetical protein
MRQFPSERLTATGGDSAYVRAGLDPTVRPKKRHKFNAVKTQSAAGFWHDSKAEAKRFNELSLAQRAGDIEALLPHPSFPLYTNGRRTGRMTFDALYLEMNMDETATLICEDTKSPITAKSTAYRQRLRTFQACYPHITVREHIV